MLIGTLALVRILVSRLTQITRLIPQITIWNGFVNRTGSQNGLTLGRCHEFLRHRGIFHLSWQLVAVIICSYFKGQGGSRGLFDVGKKLLNVWRIMLRSYPFYYSLFHLEGGVWMGLFWRRLRFWGGHNCLVYKSILRGRSHNWWQGM